MSGIAGQLPDRASSLYRFSTVVLRIFFRLFNRWEVAGRGHVPPAGGVLLVANHTSYSDPPVVGTACPRPVHFMAKADLFGFPVLRWFIRKTHAFPVRRGAADRGALRHAVRLLREGKVVLIFPEGTRSPTGRLMPFERGAAFIALASGAAVVPVAVDGADRLLPRGSPLLRPAKLRVSFGPPVDLADLQRARTTQDALEEASRRMEAAMRALLPPHRV
jgi:1-acyl-sn-glycerol-3-phosphate acyltransferase